MPTHSAETLVNEALSGIAFYHRDTNIASEIVATYKVNHILQHPTDLAVSNQFGGLVANTRYVIASAFAQADNGNETAGKFTLEKEAFFKVIDIMVVNQKTQILLLHLPAVAIEVFTKQYIPFEGKLMETHRQIFIEHSYQPPVASLQQEEWLEQTHAPIGITATGELLYDFTPPVRENIAKKKGNQFKAGADPDAPKKKSFWQKLFG